jgi:branched-chain amino acid transport system ATP-binding protein
VTTVEALLRVRELHAQYGTSRALSGVSLEVPRGQIRALLGANGAGKSTTLKAIMGLLRPAGGTVEFPAGRIINGRTADEVARLGIAYVAEGRRVLTSMTVRENLELGAQALKERSRTRRNLEREFGRFPVLSERQHQLAGTLSGGEQQQLAIARALMADPELLLLDEPSLGLAPKLIAQVFASIQQINREGTTVLLVEQNTRQALAVANWAYVLQTGRLVLEGPAERLASDPDLRAAYLGGVVAAA